MQSDSQLTPQATDTRFAYSTYQVKRKILTLAGGEFRIVAPDGALLFFSKMKAFKLKEDIRLYADESMRQEIFRIHARKALDISAVYDVIDSATETKIGALKRQGLKSMLKDEWWILDATDAQIGVIAEDSMVLALVRRFVFNMIPQKYEVSLNGTPVGRFTQNFNPFVSKIMVDFTPDSMRRLDRRLGLAAAILICAVERKQN